MPVSVDPCLRPAFVATASPPGLDTQRDAADQPNQIRRRVCPAASQKGNVSVGRNASCDGPDQLKNARRRGRETDQSRYERDVAHGDQQRT